jgi:hypothetical protein
LDSTDRSEGVPPVVAALAEAEAASPWFKLALGRAVLSERIVRASEPFAPGLSAERFAVGVEADASDAICDPASLRIEGIRVI